MKRLAFFLCLSLLAASAPAAGADQAADDTYRPPAYPGFRGASIDAAAQSLAVQVLRAGDLVELGLRHAADAADRTAGGAVFDAHSGSRGAPGAALSMHGLPASRTAVFLDSVRLPAGAYGVDLAQLPLNATDRVEVLSGPAVAPYGPGAEAGAVRLLTLMPQNPPTAAIDAGYGFYNELSVSGHNSYKPNWFGYLLALEHAAGDGWADDFAPGPLIDPESPADAPLPPQQRIERAEGHYHSANDLLLKLGADAGPLYVQALGRYHYDRNAWKTRPDGERNDRGNEFDYSCGASAAPGGVDLSLHGSGTRIERMVDETLPRYGYAAKPLPGWQERPLSINSILRLEHHEVQAAWGVDPARGQRIEGGLDFFYDGLQGRLHERAADLDAGAPFGTDRMSGGLFVEGRSELAKAVLALQPGARLDLSDRYGLLPSGHLGLLLNPHGLVRLRLDGSRAWHQPAPERALRGRLREERLVVLGDPDLVPEVGWAGALGIELGRPGGAWQIWADYFQHELDDMIISLPADQWSDGTPAVRDRNVGRARSLGASGRIELRPLSWLLCGADYTFTHARLLELEDPQGREPAVGAAPPHVAHAEIGLEIAPIKLRLQTRCGYFSEWQRRLTDGRLVGVDDSFELDARLSRNFGRYLELFVEGYNLLNTELDIDADEDNDLAPTRAMFGVKLAL